MRNVMFALPLRRSLQGQQMQCSAVSAHTERAGVISNHCRRKLLVRKQQLSVPSTWFGADS